MTEQRRKEAIEYINSQLKDGYLDLGLHDQDELEIIREALYTLKMVDEFNDIAEEYLVPTNKETDTCKKCNLIRITESNNFVVDYDKERGMYRISTFKDNHFQDEYWFDAYEEKEVPVIKEFDITPEKMYDLAVLICTALSLGIEGCKKCPVVLYDYEKRTREEKACSQEPCCTNLYKWMIDQAKKE